MSWSLQAFVNFPECGEVFDGSRVMKLKPLQNKGRIAVNFDSLLIAFKITIAELRDSSSSIGKVIMPTGALKYFRLR